MKNCRACLADKPVELFHADKRNTDGLQSYCRPCAAAKRRARYHADPEPRRQEALQRYRDKQKLAPATDEEKARKRAYDQAYRESRRDHLNAIKVEWRAKNTELVRAIRSGYKARRRAIELAGDSSADIAKWLAQQDMTCRWCGIDCETAYHIDHVHPLSKGGLHVVSNLCISCPTCNVRKNAKNPLDWAEQISKERHRCDVGMIAA